HSPPVFTLFPHATLFRSYGELLDFEPKVTLLVLSKEDWGAFTNVPVYGMPHYDDDETLIVASQDNEFWGSFIPPLENLPRELAQDRKSTRLNSSHVKTSY